MKFIQLLVVLALCCSALAQAVTTTTTLVASSSVNPTRSIYYQEAPKYVVTVTAASGSTAPSGTVTVTIGGNNRGQCSVSAGATVGLSSTCSFADIKPNVSPNLPVGSNSATVAFTPTDSNAFSASTGSATFSVFALPVVLLTYNGASDDVNVSLPSGVTNLVSTIDTTNAGTQTAPAGTIVLSQTSTNPGFSNLTCSVPTASPYTCTLAIPASALSAGLNYTLLASFVPASGSVFGPDGSKSITLRVLTTATTSTTGTTTGTTGVTTGTTTNAGVTTNSGATTTSATGYASIVANLVFNGTCTANFSQAAFATFIANSNAQAASAGYNLTEIGTCVDNNNGSFYVQLQIQAINPSVTPIPAAYQGLLGLFQTQLQTNLGLTSTGVVIISSTPAPAPSSTTTSGTTGATSATTTSGATSATTAQTTASVTATTQGATVTGTTTTGSTSAASSVVVGAAILLIFAALL